MGAIPSVETTRTKDSSDDGCFGMSFRRIMLAMKNISYERNQIMDLMCKSRMNGTRPCLDIAKNIATSKDTTRETTTSRYKDINSRGI